MGFSIRENKKRQATNVIKMLCVADHIDPLVYSPYIKKRFTDVDIILGAGDLPLTYYDFIASSLNKPLFYIFGNHDIKEAEMCKKYGKTQNDALNSSNGRMHPEAQLSGCVFGGAYLGGKVIKYKKLLIAGIDGSMWYNGNLNQYTERAMFFYLLRLIPRMLWNRMRYGRFLDVFLTHAPPFQIHDQPDICHRGFKIFRWFLKTFQPKIHIHGHIHLYGDRTNMDSVFFSTRIINAYDHIVVSLEI